VFVPRTALLKRAGQALRYTLDGQHSNGAWPYRGPPDHSPGVIDHYHTGFVLRALESIYRIEPGPEILDALRKGGEYYREYLFADGRIPRRTDRKVYPIDIHSCSEAILCCTILGERFPRFSSLADVVLEWTVNEMQDPGGFFYYRKYPLYTSRAAFLRWGQAWMMLALSEYLIRTGDGSRRQVEHSTISEAGPPR
jgi:hypothetical protein